MAQTRNFKMHPQLLYDVIMRQAGTLQKAILEGVMNAIDAGATRCDVTLDTHSFSVEDDGRGFQSKQEIEDFFETFGTPHEAGDAIYGRFRMGRGQMMAFGVNKWRSRSFRMVVDVKNKGLDYELLEDQEDIPGTKIEATLYDPIMPSDLERQKNELRKFVAWAQIPVTLNGEVVSEQPQNAKWTGEDDDAYYALSQDRSMMAVYNLGVLVNQFPAGRFGMGGTIVTKKQIEVNFARNDVQSTCNVFKRIQNRIKKSSGQAARKKTKLTDAERDIMAQEALAGELSAEDFAKARVLTCVHGRTWQMNKLATIPNAFGGNLVVGERGDLMLETAQRRAIAFSLDQGTLERFGCSSLEGFLNRIVVAIDATLKNADRYANGSWQLHRLKSLITDGNIVPVTKEHLSHFVSSEHIAVHDKELSDSQKILLTSLSSGLDDLICSLNRIQYEDLRFDRRQVSLGKSQTAYAWTDGTQNIWMEVDHAKKIATGYRGAYQVALTLLHEMLHTGPDTGTHQHDHDFYQRYHDLSGHPHDPVGRAAERMVTQFVAQLRNRGKKVSRKMLGLEDVQSQIETQLDKNEARLSANA